MARNRKSAGSPHSASSVQVEERLKARHIDYRLEPNYAIDQIADVDGNQVRLIEHRAPAEMVSRYAEQIKAGAVFPAIIVNERGELIDGNTRKLAALNAGRPTIAAYVCSNLTALEARSLSVELNQCHGLSMTTQEIHAFITGAVREGERLDTQAYARMTGVRPSTLERWKAQASYQIRAKRAGVSEVHVAALSESAQAALNGIRLTAVLVSATDLVTAAKVTVADVRKLVTAVNAAPSESAALRIVADERDSRAPDIRAIASGFTNGRGPGSRPAMHVAALLNLSVDDLLQVAPEKRAETLVRLRRLRDHLDTAVAFADREWASVVVPTDANPSLELVSVGGTRA